MPDLPQLPPIADQPLSVVLLAHNEEAHLTPVVSAWLALLQSLNRDYEILLVDDGSTDGTAALADALAAEHRQLQVLRQPSRQGSGAALRTALAVASQPLLFYTTCDCQYQPDDFFRLLAEIDKLHLASGYRRKEPVPRGIRWIGRIYRTLLRVLLGIDLQPLPAWLGWKEHVYRVVIRMWFAVRLHDMNCAFRLFRREIFTRIPIQSNGSFVHTEILAKANFLGCYMNDEIPVAYQPRQDEPGLNKDVPSFWEEFRRVVAHPDFGPAR